MPTFSRTALFQNIGPHFDSIDDALAALTELREKPASTLRLVAGDHAAGAIIWPAVQRLVPDYPDLKVDIDTDNGLTDIVTERYDAGVRLGERVAKDMIALRIGPDMRMAVVGAPSYFARHQTPHTPRDLVTHACINLRLRSSGGFYVWEFEKDQRELNVRVDGPLAFNTALMALDAALRGFGLAYVLEDRVREHLAEGRLIQVLADWCPPFSGYHLYYPARRQRVPSRVWWEIGVA